MPRAILFDLDGTLLNTLDDLAEACNASLAEAGLPPHPVEPYKRWVGDGVDTLARRVVAAAAPGREQDGELIRRVAEGHRRHYARTWRRQTSPYPGVAALLDQLAAGKVPAAVLSNKPDDAARKVVDHFFPGYPFLEVIGGRDGMPQKPDPASAAAIAQAAGIPCRDWLYLGDTDTDMATARRAGMFACGALWGFRAEAELRAAGAARLLASPGEVLYFF